MNHAPPAVMREEDYEAIEAAVMETARGRWFLAEFARRNRAVDTNAVLEAVGKVERIAVEAGSHKPIAALCDEVVATRALIEGMRGEFAARQAEAVGPRDLAALREAVERALGATLSRLADGASPRDLAMLREGLEQALAASERTGREALTGLREEIAGTRGALDAVRSDLMMRLSQIASPGDLALLRQGLEQALAANERAGRDGLIGLRDEVAGARSAVEGVRAELLARLGDTASPRDLAALREAIDQAIGADERIGREDLAELRDAITGAHGAVGEVKAELVARLAEIASPRDLAALRESVEHALGASERTGRDAVAGLREEFGTTRALIEGTRADLMARVAEAASPGELVALRGEVGKALEANERTGRELVAGFREELGTTRALIEGTRTDLLARVAEAANPGELAALREAVGEALGASQQTLRDVLAGLREELAATRGAIEGARTDLITRLAEAAAPRDLGALREAVDRVLETTERAGRDVLTAVERMEGRLAAPVVPEPAAQAVAPAPAPELPAAVEAPETAPAAVPDTAQVSPPEAEDDLFEPIALSTELPPVQIEPAAVRQEAPPPPRPATTPISIGSSALALEESEPLPRPMPRSERLDFAELSFAEKAALFS